MRTWDEAISSSPVFLSTSCLVLYRNRLIPSRNPSMRERLCGSCARGSGAGMKVGRSRGERAKETLSGVLAS